MITPEIKVNEDIILECSNLDHQIQQKILHNFEKKNQLNRTIFTDFTAILSFLGQLSQVVLGQLS